MTRRVIFDGDTTHDVAAELAATCLNGCFDLDYGDDEHEPRFCTCTAEETMAAVERLNDRGFDVVFVAARPNRDERTTQ